jgi:hypothetical protein
VRKERMVDDTVRKKLSIDIASHDFARIAQMIICKEIAL